MELIEVSCEEYSRVIGASYHIFNSAEFNYLNANKCDNLFYWLFKEDKYRLGLIVGRKNNILLSPFSAPYGGFSHLNNDISIEYIEKAIEEMLIKSKEIGAASISFTLPPIFYNSSFISKLINCLFRRKFIITTIDLNYAFDLSGLNDQYLSTIWRNARKNLKISLSKGLSFKKCDNIDSKYRAYDVIKYNREKRGYPLRMKWEELIATSNIINAELFLVNNRMQDDIGSAIVFHVKEEEIVQVIYWGDKPEYSDNKTMNFMSFNIFQYYERGGFKYVDIGPSTESSVPNYGLCEFKESIGCFVSPKITMIYKF